MAVWSLMDVVWMLATVRLAGAVVAGNATQGDLMPSDQGLTDTDVQKGCPNWQGVLVSDGEKYVPSGNDMCMQCTCDKGFPIMCHSVACSPPLQCSSPQQVKEACCEYICLDDQAPKDRNVTDIHGNADRDDVENITNLSLRLIASTVTSFLVLALLLFMVHRLRQRRLLLAMRRFESQPHQGHAEDTDSDPYIPDGFMSLECPPYTDPPPPYSPPKPPQILPGEQPPPYDEISHNVTNADENRNQIRGVNSSSGSSRGTQSNFTGHRRTTSRNNTQMEGGSTRVGPQGRSVEATGTEQTDGSDGMRPANSLPVYASTDVVEGLGVVISPGSDMVCYSSGWHTWIDAHAGHDRSGIQTETRQQRSPHRRQFNPSVANSSRVHVVPAATAFQRFSNIFRRDSWKMKNWRRPTSEYSVPPHYATVPRNEQSPRSRVGNAHSQAAVKNTTTRPSSGGYPDTLCLSFETGQATLTLGAVSPSTSSSNSSEQYEQLHAPGTIVGSSTTSATTPGASSSGNSVSPPDRSVLRVDDFLLSPAHRQQFYDDLCRHLPPLQLPASEVAAPASDERTSVSSSKLTSTESVANNILTSQCSAISAAGSSIPHTARHTFKDAVKDTRNHLGKPIASHHLTSNIIPTSSSSSSSSSQHKNETLQSMAAFIRSNPLSSSALDGRDRTPPPSAGAVTMQTFQRSSCPRVLPTTGECSQVMGSSYLQAAPEYFTPAQNGTSTFTQETVNRLEMPPMGQASNSQRASQETASSFEIRNTEQLEQPALDDLVTMPQEFQVIFPFSGTLTPVTPALTSSTTSSTVYASMPPLLAAAAVPATSSTSPSPSPPTVPVFGLGALRRSQSGASQASMFSVCSETGEKKLKSADLAENDAKVSSGDSCHSLSRSRAGLFHEPLPAARSLLPLIDVSRKCMSETGQHITLSSPGSFNDIRDLVNQQSLGFGSLYPQSTSALSVENGNVAASLGLATAAAFPYNTSSHSQVAITTSGSVLPSCSDVLTNPTGMHQNVGSWHGNSYNFNSLTEVDKSVAVKDVPLLYGGDRMTQSINIPPIPPFITAQSGQILFMPVPDDPANLSKSGKGHEVLKKLKKKRIKDKNCSGSQCCNIPRHTSSSPKHHSFKSSEKGKDEDPIQKVDCVVKEKDMVGSRAMRPGDKKHRAHSGAGRQHVRLFDSLNCNKTASRSTGDTATIYGNADIYRSIAGDGIATASGFQHPGYGPWNHQETSCSCDQTFATGTAINDLNQPPGCLKAVADNSSPSLAVADGTGQVKTDTRRKNGHRRQSSAGEKVGHLSSPSRYKSRPKSLATPDMHVNEKRVDIHLPRPSLTASDFGVAGKGARSGFGHDLNFDDQSGLADLHIHEVDCSSRRVSIGQDSFMQPGVNAARKLSRGEGNGEPLNVVKASNSNGYHPGSRSGLSSELSFTSRTALNGNHNRKRQSLPAVIGGSPLPGVHDRAHLCSSIAARPKPSEDCHVNLGQVRSERRLDKPVFVDDGIEATSYV